MPSDELILLAMLLGCATSPCADEVCGALADFGCVLTAQRVASALGRLSREEMPMIAVSPMRWTPNIKVYRLTRFGYCHLGNRWPRLRPVIREQEGRS